MYVKKIYVILDLFKLPPLRAHCEVRYTAKISNLCLGHPPPFFFYAETFDSATVRSLGVVACMSIVIHFCCGLVFPKPVVSEALDIAWRVAM